MIQQIGHSVLMFPEWFGRLLFMIWEIIVDLTRLIRGQYQLRLFAVLKRQTLLQVWYTAIQVMPLLGSISIGIGVLVLAIGFQTLQSIGAEELFIPILRHGIIGELVPLIISIIVLARSSTAMTADVASQVINGEMDLMKAHNMSPPLLILLPRILGTSLSLLSLVGICMGLLAASTFIISPLLDISLPQLKGIWSASLVLVDIQWVGTKLTLNGLLISLISCYTAMNIRRDIRELPKASSQSVIISLFSLFLLEAIMLFFRWLS